MKTIVHIIPHAHWDREWYMPLELHRARLIDQLDRVLTLLENDSSYTYHLDGQMIAVEDYLRFRPERAEQMKRFVREGRLHVGPWYVLQDEYLTGGEANVRNLLRGMRAAEQMGAVCRIGYLPDAFGNVGQMPQLFAQAGLKAAAFGRGVTLNDEHPDPAGHSPRYSEFSWESPDGSSVPAIFFAGWYNNAQEIPVDPAEAKTWWDERLAHARSFASSRHLLFLNGADHEPVQRNLAGALETARSLYPDIEFICSDFEHYIECVNRDRLSGPETVCGELAGQESDGTNTLCNTASTRAPIKKLNRRNESLLALEAEPMLAMAALAGMKTDSALLRHAWDLLMENHPHDSICGCGVDALHRETVTRYEKSIQLGEFLVQRAGAFLAGKIAAGRLNGSNRAFAVFNPTGKERTQVLTVTVGADRVWGPREVRKELTEREPGIWHLTDHEGREIPAIIEDAGIRFGYELPEDTFRRPYFERQVRVNFEAEAVPAFGRAVFYLEPGEPQGTGNGLRTGERQMENRFLSVTIDPNGTFDLTLKKTGRVYRGLGLFEDTGDVGDEYIFRETLGSPVTTEKADAVIECTEDTPFRTVFTVRTEMELPVSAGAALSEAREAMVRRMKRNIGRSHETEKVTFTAVLTLEKNSPLLRVKAEFTNTVKDHRVRMLFPTDLLTESHFADSVFDVTERPDVPGPNWTNPSRCQRMQYFAGAQDGQGGLAVLNRGAYEYEILPERKTVAVTLLRSVGELGDWGVFPTPDAQCIGPVSMELGILPYAGDDFRADGCMDAVQFQTDMLSFPLTGGTGELAPRGGVLAPAGKGLAVTALKPSEDEKALILRAVNVTENASELVLALPEGCACFESNVTEERIKRIRTDETGHVRAAAGKKEIKTVRIETL